jgi:hypothetical protein
MADWAQSQRLIDYFFIGGLGPASINGADERSVELNDSSISPLNHVYIGEILARHPPVDRDALPFNSGNVLSFCFPDRIVIRATFQAPHFHTFALTNELGYVRAATPDGKPTDALQVGFFPTAAHERTGRVLCSTSRCPTTPAII